MKLQLRLILSACVAHLVGTSVQVQNLAPIEVADLSERVHENFQNLFNSVANNNGKIGNEYRGVLKDVVGKEQEYFDTLRDELRIRWDQPSNKERNSYNRIKARRDSIRAVKRQAQENNPSAVPGVAATGNESVTVSSDDDDDDDIPVTETPEFVATPITGPFLEPAYYDCLMEAKWQMDDQRFHIKFVKDSYKVLNKLGLKIPEFQRLLGVIEDFYNFTCQEISRKMRGDEESDEKYDPTYKAAFLRLNHIWHDLIVALENAPPKYHTENRIKRLMKEMYNAANTSHETYYLISELQTKMETTARPPRTAFFTTPPSNTIRLG